MDVISVILFFFFGYQLFISSRNTDLRIYKFHPFIVTSDTQAERQRLGAYPRLECSCELLRYQDSCLPTFPSISTQTLAAGFSRYPILARFLTTIQWSATVLEIHHFRISSARDKRLLHLLRTILQPILVLAANHQTTFSMLFSSIFNADYFLRRYIACMPSNFYSKSQFHSNLRRGPLEKRNCVA